MWVMVGVDEAQALHVEIAPATEVSWWTSTVHVGKPRGVSAPTFVDETLIRNSDFDRSDEPQFREFVEGSVGRLLVAIDEFVTTVERTATDPPGWQPSSRSPKDTRHHGCQSFHRSAEER